MDHSFLKYKSTNHAAVRTQEYLFNQLFPYIGNKRKLLPLIFEAILRCHSEPKVKNLMTLGDSSVVSLPQNDIGAPLFVDFFSGSGVVSRLAKKLGFQVIANDWEPYSFFYNNAGNLVRREKDLKDDNEKEVEYITNGNVDSTAYFEDGKLDYVSHKKKRAEKINDTIPEQAYADGYNEIWKSDSKFTYDSIKRLTQLYFNLDGSRKYYEYKYEGDLIIRKKFRTDPEGPYQTITEYNYEFY